MTKQAKEWYETLKDNPQEIIDWCKREIEAYQDLIKLIEENLK